MRHTHLAQAIGAALSSTMSTHVSYAYSQAQVVLGAHLDSIKVKTQEIESELQVLQAAQAKLTVLLGVGPEKIGIDETRNTDMAGIKRRGIIDTIAGHRDKLSQTNKRLDNG